MSSSSIRESCADNDLQEIGDDSVLDGSSKFYASMENDLTNPLWDLFGKVLFGFI